MALLSHGCREPWFLAFLTLHSCDFTSRSSPHLGHVLCERLSHALFLVLGQCLTQSGHRK